MATMQGITGKLSGKMGSAVFRVRSGQQVVAQYNPIVKNPNTEGQQAQRAKFKLMSQLAAIMAKGMGSFIIKTRAEKGKPSQRNMFTQLNLPLVEVTSDDQEVTAKIPMEQLKLTSSFRNLGSMVVTGGGNDVHFIINVPDSSVKSVRCVLVGYPVTNGNKQATIISMADFPVIDNEVDQDFTDVAAGDYTLLAYGLIPTETAAGKINLDSIHTPADDEFVSAVELNKLVSDGAIVETMTIGANVSVTE